MIDCSVQTEIKAKYYKFVKLSTSKHLSTQTESCYFPYDEETRQRIANILGNKMVKHSDLVSN